MSTDMNSVSSPLPPDGGNEIAWPPGRVFTPERVPLYLDEHGDIRVTGSRVTLDTIVAEYESGATPQAIAQGFDTVELADVYSIIGFYLRHRPAVQQYLQTQEAKAAEAWKKAEAAGMTRPGIREELQARMARRESKNAPSAD
jgi:uncharacterized protein (DUF433 family)